MTEAAITRGYRSFLQAYEPQHGVIITKDFLAEAIFEKTCVHFIPLSYLEQLFYWIDQLS